MNNNEINKNKCAKVDSDIAYYSRILNKPFDSVAELKLAE
jgi:hypothetical protein